MKRSWKDKKKSARDVCMRVVELNLAVAMNIERDMNVNSILYKQMA